MIRNYSHVCAKDSDTRRLTAKELSVGIESNCPHTDQLRAVLNGAAAPEEQKWIETHLELCGRCRVDLERMAANGGGRAAVTQGGATEPVDDLALPDGLRAAIAAQPISPPSRRGPIHPAQIGPYRVLECLGAGGMGSVYKAEQRHPIQRIVAVKIIKPGFDTGEVIARFESERQALARMDHPSIAKVLDAGTTDSGRPYFVMEYVAGVPITQFADEKKLTLRQRLQLFLPVCHAINHAHIKAIIHRDIKSKNVLAYLSEGGPVVKVIDFGIAKALTGDRLTDATFNTERGQILGTIESMSPEQADGSPDIDTRTDVYSLGVLLYEILTGVQPFDRQTLSNARQEEIRRIIREVDPPRPSTRLSESRDLAPKIAAARRSRLDQLTSEMRDELEWIPLKALRKERDRRYVSATQMAEDIQNYLDKRPLIAGPESRAYRAKKFLKRHVVPIAVVLAFITTIAVASVLHIRNIRGEQAKTARERDEAQRQKGLAVQQEQLARQTADFLIKTLQSQDPFKGGTQDISVGQAMQQAIERLNQGELSQQPALHASLLAAIAEILKNIGQGSRALPLAQQALDIRRSLFKADHADVARSLNGMAELLRDQGKLAESEPMLREALAMRQRLFGTDAVEVAESLNDLAGLLHARNNLAEAEPLFREALVIWRRTLPPTHPNIALCLNNLAALLQDRSKFVEAEALYKEALAISRQALPAGHPNIAANLNNLAELLRAQGRFGEAEPLYREALEIWRNALPPEHPDIASSLNNLAMLLQQQGKRGEAESRFREAIEIWRKALPAGHPAIAQGLINLALVLQEQRNFADAEAPLREALVIHTQAHGKTAPATLQTAADLADLLQRLGRDSDAKSIRSEYNLIGASHSATAPATAP